ncbi:hypothetical protein ACG0Z6_06840 [Roseateles sp. BYS180W]|uniref:DUF3995 domain-containing protein n=1 Tax=Roseateles rivi TaxID=3299028 RepID=A0ABW7FUJ0_9BURK
MTTQTLDSAALAAAGMNPQVLNSPLLWAGVLSAAAALMHLACIVGGPAWYRYFGAGERMAQMAAAGQGWPALLTLGITVVLLVWSGYALGASGYVPALRALPWMGAALLAITAIYLLRAVLLLPVWWFKPELVDSFALWSSVVCGVFGAVHAWGLWLWWGGAR